MITEETNNTEVKEPEKTVDPLADFLGGYKNITLQDNSVHPEGTPNTAPSINAHVIPNNGQQVPVDKSDPVRYYQTGKKAGQPRPPKRAAITVNPAIEQTSLSGSILTGALFLTLIDLLMPMIVAGLNNRFSKQKIKPSDLSLTKAQKNELAPIADRVVKQFDFNGNPNVLLLVSMFGIYGANLAMVKLSTPNINKKQDENFTENNYQK